MRNGQPRYQKQSNSIQDIIPKESVICKQIVIEVSHLKSLNYFANEFALIHIANENVSGLGYRRHLKAIGLMPGALDYLLLYTGGCAFIEVKRDHKCKLSPMQVKFTKLLDSLGINWIVAHSPQEVTSFIKKVVG